MTNIEKLKKSGILKEVRLRMGAEDENDTSCDDVINLMDNSKLVEQWCAWKLGDGSWWKKMKSHFDELEKLSENKS
jgi:hypothetical protein